MDASLFPGQNLPPDTRVYGENANMLFMSGTPVNSFSQMFFAAATPGGAPLVLLYFHGNGEQLSDAMALLEQMFPSWLHRVAIEYSGYGLSRGPKPTVKNVNATAWSVCRSLLEECRWPANRILLVGRSMGTGPAVWLAQKLAGLGTPAAGLLLFSPFTTLAALVKSTVRGVTGSSLLGSVTSILVGESWATMQAIANVNCRVHMVHGADDELIDANNTRELYDAAVKGSCQVNILPNTGHNSMNLFQTRTIALFIATCCAGLQPLKLDTGRCQKWIFSTSLHGAADKQRPPSFMESLRGMSRSLVDGTVQKHGSGNKPVFRLLDSCFETDNALKNYVYQRLKEARCIVRHQFPEFLHHSDSALKDLLVHLGPFPDFWAEFSPLQAVKVPLSSAHVSRAFGLAEFGAVHTQIRIGGILFSWDQSADASPADIGFKPALSGKTQRLCIPVRLHGFHQQWWPLILQLVRSDDVSVVDEGCTMVADQFCMLYGHSGLVERFPSMNAVRQVIHDYNRGPYLATAKTCQDFFGDTLRALFPHAAELSMGPVLRKHLSRAVNHTSLIPDASIIVGLESDADFVLARARWQLQKIGVDAVQFRHLLTVERTAYNRCRF